MKHYQIALLGVAAMFLAGCQAESGAPRITASGHQEHRFMQEFGTAMAPIGYVAFCRRDPAECPAGHDKPERVAMTAERWMSLNIVNTFVNRKIEPTTDEELYHVAELWTLPSTRGDCEDYVLQKRKMLAAEGWPESSLLITVVRDEEGAGHAVLTVATDMGDLILDNKTDLIRPWADTGYVYYKRQSRSDPRAWVALTPNAQTDRALAATESGFH